jgi:prepilin-type N-terminal cleavage/methylation domain-containing protein
MSLQSKNLWLRRTALGGFTLLEMMIVIAVMLLLVIATLPRIKYALDESKLRESSRQLNSYLSMAKARAATTGRPCGVMFITTRVGDPSVNPGVFQSTQLYLAETPTPYSGDWTDARVVVSDSNGDTWGRIRKGGLTMATAMQGPPWRLNFTPAGSAGGLLSLVADGETFAAQFDDRPMMWLGYRSGNVFYLNGQTSPFTATFTYPPTATSEWTDQYGTFHADPGYHYKIIRTPARIGAPLAMPRGTTIDLAYSGFGNSGTDFYSSPNPVMVMFSPDGKIANVTYTTWNSNNSVYQTINNDAQGTVHFLIGRPEKVGLAIPQSNIWDNNALWVSVGRMTGSVVTTDNAPNVNLPFATPAQQQVFLTTAREFAITQDVKGGR